MMAAGAKGQTAECEAHQRIWKLHQEFDHVNNRRLRWWGRKTKCPVLVKLNRNKRKIVNPFCEEEWNLQCEWVTNPVVVEGTTHRESSGACTSLSMPPGPPAATLACSVSWQRGTGQVAWLCFKALSPFPTLYHARSLLAKAEPLSLSLRPAKH